jgi:sulfur relay (sulfurtransferase) complex TusBCD TusD component (DsrE family)
MATLPLVRGLNLATMSDLATWTLEVDKVITF